MPSRLWNLIDLIVDVLVHIHAVLQHLDYKDSDDSALAQAKLASRVEILKKEVQ